MSDHAPLALGLAQYGAAAVLVALDVLARTWRTTALLPISFVRAVRGNLIGDAAAAVTPARLGGDPMRFAQFVKTGQEPASILAAFAIETIINAIILALAAIVAAVVLGESVHPTAESRTVGGEIPWGWALISVLLIGAIVVAMVRGRWKPRQPLTATLKESWRQLRAQPPSRVFAATLWTLVSFAARGGVLTALLAGVPGVTPRLLWLASLGALYVLLLAPTPGGAGVVELGFFAGLRQVFDLGDLAWLIAVWRVYAYAVTAVIGALLLARDAISKRASRTL